MTKEEIQIYLSGIVRAVGKSIMDNADRIAGDYEYGEGIEISCTIDPFDKFPDLKVTRGFTTKDIIKAVQNK